MKWSAVIFDMDGLMIDSEAIALEVWNELAGEYGREVSKELYSQVIGETPQYGARTETMCKRVVPAEGLIELLELLRSNDILVAVASNSPCDYVLAVLRSLDLLTYFECVLSSEDVDRGKPAPDVFWPSQLPRRG